MFKPKPTALNEAEVSEWWRTELSRMRPELEARFQRRSAAFGYDAEDLAQDLVVRLVAAFGKNREAYPASWFIRKSPAAAELHAFRALVWAIASNIHRDHLRRIYSDRKALEALKESVAATEAPGLVEQLLDARRVLEAIARVVSGLDHDDQELLGERKEEASLSATQRSRLFRLRRRIAEEVVRSIDTRRT